MCDMFPAINSDHVSAYWLNFPNTGGTNYDKQPVDADILTLSNLSLKLTFQDSGLAKRVLIFWEIWGK